MFQAKKIIYSLSNTINKTILLKILIFTYLFISYNIAQAQENTISNTLVSLNVKNMLLSDVLSNVEKMTSFKFAYNAELISKRKITINVQNLSLDKVLILIFKSVPIKYTNIGQQIILEEIPKITISGYIKDSISGEAITGATIYLPKIKTSTYTNNYGFYSITIRQSASIELIVSSVQYKKASVKVIAKKSSGLNIKLTKAEIPIKSRPALIELPTDTLKQELFDMTNFLLDSIKKESIISDENYVPIKSIKSQPLISDRKAVSEDLIKTISAISGNADIINSIQLLPGVISGLDGRSGFFVRGGNTDQNLVQLDEAILYNPNHLLELVSVFNAPAIRNAIFLKEGFPAMYGDHLSSVLDISMKEGNSQKFGGDLELGTITSGLTIYAPVIHNKASFLLSARKSTIDLFLKPFHLKNYYNDYSFYDINAKINFQLSQKDRVYLSFYQGKDNSFFSIDSIENNAISYDINFGNRALSLRWNHLYSQKLFSNTSIIYNNYYQTSSTSQQQYYANIYSGISDIDFKTDLNYYPNMKHQIGIGIDYLYQTLFPASVSDKAITTGSYISINPSEIPGKYSNRLAVYFGDNIDLSSKFSVYLGGRMPVYFKNDVQYISLEPRLSLQFLVNPTTGLKISYTQMHQYLHLVQSYNASYPAEIWIGSSKIVKPQNSQQISIGLFKNFYNNMFQSNIEVYYKKMGNQLLFKGEMQPAIVTNMDSALIFGQGQAYGTEFSVRKTSGKLTGWLAYNLSYAYQQFDSLNLGESFPSANDRRHSLHLSVNYAFNEHWNISSVFVFTSGSSFTLKKSVLSGSVNPDDNPLYDDIINVGSSDDGTTEISDNGSYSQIQQNNYRLKPYNRLDISISYSRTKKLKKRDVETKWIFSVYNVYAYPNTFFTYRSIDPVTKLPIANQVSFVPIIPSISYNLKF